MTGGPKSDAELHNFLSDDESLQSRLNDIATVEDALLIDRREADLRDAPRDADSPVTPPPPKAVADSLPGVKPVVPCESLQDCATPELATNVFAAKEISEGLGRLLKPWVILQKARHSELSLTSVDSPASAVLAMRLDDVDTGTIYFNVTSLDNGGFKVWASEPLVLAALYAKERETALSSKPTR